MNPSTVFEKLPRRSSLCRLVGLGLFVVACTEPPKENHKVVTVGGTIIGTPTGSGGATSGSGGATSGSGGSSGGSESDVLGNYDCGDAPSTKGAFTKQLLRKGAGLCAEWHYCRSHGAIKELKAETAKLSTGVLPAKSPEFAKIQPTFRAFARTWAESELFQFGPLPVMATSTLAVYDPYQGRGLRPVIYSWPQVARCKTEEQIASKKYESNLAGILVTGRGLHALDYLLYYGGKDSSCAAASPTATTIASLSESELGNRRRAYAQLLTEDLTTRIGDLRTIWKPDGENFAATWENAVGYPSEQEAMNVLAWSLLYMERQVKDWKLGITSGAMDPGLTPVSELETPYSGLGSDLLRANITAFERLFSGCSGREDVGFDDWLIEAGHEDLTSDIRKATDNAQAILEKLPAAGVATQNDYLLAYNAVKELTNFLKTDLFGSGSPLNLELPAGLEGDTD